MRPSRVAPFPSAHPECPTGSLEKILASWGPGGGGLVTVAMLWAEGSPKERHHPRAGGRGGSSTPESSRELSWLARPEGAGGAGLGLPGLGVLVKSWSCCHAPPGRGLSALEPPLPLQSGGREASLSWGRGNWGTEAGSLPDPLGLRRRGPGGSALAGKVTWGPRWAPPPHTALEGERALVAGPTVGMRSSDSRTRPSRGPTPRRAHPTVPVGVGPRPGRRASRSRALGPCRGPGPGLRPWWRHLWPAPPPGVGQVLPDPGRPLSSAAVENGPQLLAGLLGCRPLGPPSCPGPPHDIIQSPPHPGVQGRVAAWVSGWAGGGPCQRRHRPAPAWLPSALCSSRDRGGLLAGWLSSPCGTGPSRILFQKP